MKNTSLSGYIKWCASTHCYWGLIVLRSNLTDLSSQCSHLTAS